MTAQAAGYRHEALPYKGHDEFVRSSAAFLRAGLARDERLILIAVRDKVADVRDELGHDADLVSFHDMAVAGRNPARILSVFQHFVEADDSGRRMRGLGEPIYPSRSPVALKEAQLHELLLNSAVCNSWDFWLGCPYDVTALDENVLTAMRASHPFVGGRPEAGWHADGLATEFFATELSGVPGDARSYDVDGTDLAGARRFVRRAAAAAGYSSPRLEDLICAVNEVVTNSMRHARGGAVVSVWRADGMLACDVRDSGWIHDELVGRLAPSTVETGGRGLWLVNHLCDLVQVRSSAAGTSVRMYLDF